MTPFREIRRNVHFWAKKGIFGHKLVQNRPNRIFWAKSENVTSVELGFDLAPTLCQISENSYERILRSLSNGRTHGRTDGCEFIGSARYRGKPKIRNIHSGVWKL